MKVPSDFSDFLKNGSNKEMLLDLLERSYIENKERLESKVVYFSNKEHCVRISQSNSSVVEELYSDHEEADTKLIAFAHQAESENIVIRSPSGDIDIPVLVLLHFTNKRVIVDNGNGKSRKLLDMSTSGLSAEERKSVSWNACFFWQ